MLVTGVLVKRVGRKPLGLSFGCRGETTEGTQCGMSCTLAVTQQGPLPFPLVIQKMVEFFVVMSNIDRVIM